VSRRESRQALFARGVIHRPRDENRQCQDSVLGVSRLNKMRYRIQVFHFHAPQVLVVAPQMLIVATINIWGAKRRTQ